MTTHPYFAERHAADHRSSLRSVADNTRRAKQPVPAEPAPPRRLVSGTVRRRIRVRSAPTS